MARFIEIDGNAPPPGANPVDFEGADGGRLRGGVFPLDGARGTVIVLGGRSEFIEKYFEVIGDLRARGLAAASMDWRGQGLSDRLLPIRELGHILDFGAFRADLRQFFETVVSKRLPGPYAILAHSMGGVPVLQMLADGDRHYCAAVLTAPMTRLFDNVFKRFAVRAIAEAAARTALKRRPVSGLKEHSMAFEGNVLTSDPVRHQRFKELQGAAPNAVIREPTYGWVRAASEAMDDLHRPNRFQNLATPTLIISAGRDQLVRSSDHARLAAASPLIACAEIDASLHEIQMESDAIRAEFWALFDGFALPKIDAARTSPR